MNIVDLLRNKRDTSLLVVGILGYNRISGDNKTPSLLRHLTVGVYCCHPTLHYGWTADQLISEAARLALRRCSFLCSLGTAAREASYHHLRNFSPYFLSNLSGVRRVVNANPSILEGAGGRCMCCCFLMMELRNFNVSV